MVSVCAARTLGGQEPAAPTFKGADQPVEDVLNSRMNPPTHSPAYCSVLPG